MRLNVEIDTNDLLGLKAQDVFELYQRLYSCEKERFLSLFCDKDRHYQTLKYIFSQLSNEQKNELLQELQGEIVSDEKFRQSLEYLKTHA